MGHRTSEIFKIEGSCIGFPKKSQSSIEESLEALEESHMANVEYMNMTRFIEETEDQGCDNAIDEFCTIVSKQDEGITAIANALTSLSCKGDARVFNSFAQRVSDVDFRGKFKAVCCHNPSKMVLKNVYFTLKECSVDRLNDLNAHYLMKHYDSQTGVKLDHYEYICPKFYKFLGESFAVWDGGDTNVVNIFRELYGLTDIHDFMRHVHKFGFHIKIPYTDTNAEVCGGGELIIPERFNGRFDDQGVGLNRGLTRRDRISGFDIPRPYFGEERIRGQVFEFDDVDNSYAEAMKAKRDGKTWDEETLTCSRNVNLNPKPELTMAEEIEQRLIDKYLT